MVSQREEKGDNKESGYRGCTNQGYRIGKGTATIKRTDTETIQIKGVAAEGKGR